jgi:hypothetical protein
MLIRILIIALIMFGFSSGIQATPSTPTFSEQTLSERQKKPENFSIEFFPVAPYNVGDVLSARLTYTGQEDISGREITIALADQPEQILETATFSDPSHQAVFYWVIDTQGQQPGFLKFLFDIPEMGLAWETGVNLLPNQEGEARSWSELHTDCCIIHTITGTDAEEDILEIQQILEIQTREVLAQFQSKIGPTENLMEEPLSLVLIPSVIGQGGFATDIAVMTYTDRNWAGTDFANIAHHEIVHVIDRQLNNGPRPSLFSEGLAVYFAGGHYRDGDPLLRAAALLETDQYIPITSFVDDFYAAQHEISYLEAGALVAYLSEIWGIDEFLEFYFNLPEADTDSESISLALEEQFDMTLEELESDFLTYLRSKNPSPKDQANVRLTIATYEAMRRYQKIRVPSAYFRNAWWPPMERALEKGIAGDYAPREKMPVDVIIENLFLDLYPAIELGEVQKAEEQLVAIHKLLDLAENQGNGFSHYSIGWPFPHSAHLTPGD